MKNVFYGPLSDPTGTLQGAFVALGEDGKLIISYGPGDYTSPIIGPANALRFSYRKQAGSFYVNANLPWKAQVLGGEASSWLQLKYTGRSPRLPVEFVFTNDNPSVTSWVASLTVLAPVTITSQPQGQIVVVGASANFTVGATGTGPFFYQWWQGDVALTHATNATLTLVGITTNHAGVYSVVVSNAATAAASQAAILTVAHSFFAPPPPQSAQAVRTSGFQLSLGLEVGRMFTVQTSSDLVTWQAMTNFTSTNAVLQFLDMAATYSDRRFYRIVSP